MLHIFYNWFQYLSLYKLWACPWWYTAGGTKVSRSWSRVINKPFPNMMAGIFFYCHRGLYHCSPTTAMMAGTENKLNWSIIYFNQYDLYLCPITCLTHQLQYPEIREAIFPDNFILLKVLVFLLLLLVAVSLKILVTLP